MRQKQAQNLRTAGEVGLNNSSAWRAHDLKAGDVMKDVYDFSQLAEIPHPFRDRKTIDGKSVLLPSIRDISDAVFERGIQNLGPDEREFAVEYRIDAPRD
jgi:hypothetical protein